MYMIAEVSQYVAVASFTEAWIEILEKDNITDLQVSPPSRRRGLKLIGATQMDFTLRRLLHGGVD